MYYGIVTSTTLQQRKRRLLQTELTEIALRLFREKGYDATTVDDLAAASGVSRRTFFRYFSSKEDVVATKWTAMGEGFLAALADRPATEKPWTSLRRACDGIVEHYADAGRRADSYALDEVVDATPALRAAFAAKVDLLADTASEILVSRGLQPLAARTLAGACAAALVAAMRRSRADGAEGIGADLDKAMSAIRAAPSNE